MKREGPKSRVIRCWDNNTTETLAGCFEATDWDVFFDETDNDQVTDAITSYVRFCEDNVVQTKEVKIYPNNKPWVTKDLKQCLNEKKAAFLSGDRQKVKELDKEFKRKARIAKREYKDKVEDKFVTGNASEAWRGLNTMMGRSQKQNRVQCNDSETFANDLNQFYARFDTHNFSQECDQLCDPLLDKINGTDVFLVSEENVNSVFARINPRKATGPDGLGGRVLKECRHQLSHVFTRLFQLLLDTHYVPRIWRTSLITPVPKKPQAKVMNDFRPVALTSVLCKCMERVVCNRLTSTVANRMDPLQFAYRAKRGVEDATLTLLDLVMRHLDNTGTFVRVLLMDFSSAFNTIQPHLLLSRLIDLDVSPHIVLWIRSFLRDRPQRVNVNRSLSNELVLSTGAPQGCVLSPILFSIYTNEITCSTSILTLIKFADDMALIARLKNEHSLSQYFDFVNFLANWFDSSFLELNITKTKELCFEEHRAKDASLLRPVTIKGESVEKVESFKYLGTVLDKNLSFSFHVDHVCKKANQRLFLIRKLRSFEVRVDILECVYRSLIESILMFNAVSWYGNLSVKDKARLNRVVNVAGKVVGRNQKQPSELYGVAVKKKANKIVGDRTHPLNDCFELLPSGRRLRHAQAKLGRYTEAQKGLS